MCQTWGQLSTFHVLQGRVPFSSLTAAQSDEVATSHTWRYKFKSLLIKIK